MATSSWSKAVLLALLAVALFFMQRDVTNILRHFADVCVASQDFVSTHRDFFCLQNVSFYAFNASATSSKVSIAFPGSHSLQWLLAWQWRASVVGMFYLVYRVAFIIQTAINDWLIS
jgi:hypothetical protein